MSTPNLPQNFGRAFDLSSLKKPAANSTPTQPGVAIEATPENLVRDFVSVSNSTPVVLLAWSARMPESVQVLEILNKLKITQVSSDDYLNNDYDYPVYVNIDTMDYNQRYDLSKGSFNDFITNPSLYESTFMKYANKSDIFIAGHYFGSGSPYLFTRFDARSEAFKIRVVADISCDIDGPVASTIRPSSISNPIYGYNPITEMEDDFSIDGIIAVMAVDNLPCELSKDASEGVEET